MLREGRAVAPALANDDGIVAGDIHHGRWLDAAAAAVDEQVDPAGQRHCDLLPLGQGDFLAGQQQGRTHHGLAKGFEECLRYRVVRHPYPDGLPFRILQATRQLPRRLEDERVGPRCVGTQQAVAPVLDPGVGCNLGEVTAHQCEVVILAGVANALEAAGRIMIAQVPAKGVAGIRGVNDQAIPAEDLRGLLNEAPLGIVGMDVESLGHAAILSAAAGHPRRRPLAYHVPRNPNHIPIMQALVDLLPLLAFAATYWLTRNMQTAILVIMVTISLQVAVIWLVKRTVSRMLLTSAVLVVVLGGISLLLNNDLVFKWKPTVLNWLFAAVFLGSRYIGDRTIAQRILDSIARDEFRMTPADWQKLNLMWVAFFLLSGAANIFVAYRFPEGVWVNFKLFGLTGMTLVFALLQGLWLSKRATEDK